MLAGWPGETDSPPSASVVLRFRYRAPVRGRPPTLHSTCHGRPQTDPDQRDQGPLRDPRRRMGVSTRHRPPSKHRRDLGGVNPATEHRHGTVKIMTSRIETVGDLTVPNELAVGVKTPHVSRTAHNAHRPAGQNLPKIAIATRAFVRGGRQRAISSGDGAPCLRPALSAHARPADSALSTPPRSPCTPARQTVSRGRTRH